MSREPCSDFSVESKDKYQQAYQSLSRDDLASSVKDMENIKPASIESDHAQYYFEKATWRENDHFSY